MSKAIKIIHVRVLAVHLDRVDDAFGGGAVLNLREAQDGEERNGQKKTDAFCNYVDHFPSGFWSYAFGFPCRVSIHSAARHVSHATVSGKSTHDDSAVKRRRLPQSRPRPDSHVYTSAELFFSLLDLT